MNFVAVTSCPTGIAHCQMAAENLRRTATESEHELRIEIQSARGTENELSKDEISAADAVIVAADAAVNRERFKGKPIVARPVGDAVTDAESLLREATRIARDDGPCADERPSADSADPAVDSADVSVETTDASTGPLARFVRLLDRL